MFKATPNPPETVPIPHEPELESQKTKEAADRALDFYLVTARPTAFHAGKKARKRSLAGFSSVRRATWDGCVISASRRCLLHALHLHIHRNPVASIRTSVIEKTVIHEIVIMIHRHGLQTLALITATDRFGVTTQRRVQQFGG